MISHEHKFIYVAIPKTGSASINDWSKRNFEAEQIGRYHGFKIPKEFNRYLVFTIIRNPYERCWSWYWFEELRDQNGWSFEEHFRQRLKGKNKNGRGLYHPLWASTQKTFVERSKARYVIKLEGLELNVLPFVNSEEHMKIPHIRKTRGKPKGLAVDLMTKKQKDIVLEYCEEDFEVFGYEK
jgi:hypothetical protein